MSVGSMYLRSCRMSLAMQAVYYYEFALMPQHQLGILSSYRMESIQIHQGYLKSTTR